MTDATTRLVYSLRAARLRLHLGIVPTSVGLSALLGAVATGALWDTKPHSLLLAWNCALAIALVFRVWVRSSHRRAIEGANNLGAKNDAQWLLRYRLCFFIHGMAWGAAGLVLQDATEASRFSLFTIAMVAIAAGSLNSTTFDVKAGLLFVVATLGPMLTNVFLEGDRAATVRGLIVVTFMVATLIGARRAERIFEEAENLRLAEATRAAEARQNAGFAEQARIELADQIRLLSEAEFSLKIYELVANSITDMVSVIGEDLVYRMVNDAWCKNLGLRREDVINRKTSDVLSRSVSTDERRAALLACISEQRVNQIRSLINFPGQPARHIETTYYPYLDTVGAQSVRCVVMVSRDITDEELARQQLAESALYLQRTLNATGDAIFASEAGNHHDKVRFVNEQMLDMWGIPHDKLTTLTPHDIMTYATPLFEEPEAEGERVAMVIATNSRHESRVRLRDGRVLLRRCIPAQIGERTLRVWSFRDITALEAAIASEKASEAGHRALMDAFPGYITQVDENLVYMYANQRVAQRLGTTRENMVGHSVREVVGEETHAWLQQYVTRALAGERVTYERRHSNPDGSVAFDQVSMIRGEDWRTGRYVLYTFGIDITERKLAERQLVDTSEQLRLRSEELQLTLESVREGEIEMRDLLGSFPGYIVAINKDFQYVYANEKIAGFLGTTPQQMKGRHMSEVLGEARFQAIQNDVAIAREQGRFVRQNRYPANSTRAAMDMEVTLVAGLRKANGEQTTYVFGLDVTARTQAEEAIISARDAAESASRAKSDFLSHMSHELRTPMNAILGFGQLLELDHQSESDRQDWGREVVKGGRHLLSLINEVLDLARVESGKMPINLEPLAVQPLIDDCLMLVHPQANARNIQLFNHTLPANLSVLADSIRLKQIVLNLLSNAIKYNSISGTVTVTCEPFAADPEGQSIISVTDTGGGLTPAQIARLFQPFERLDADAEHIEGSGIGLVLTRRLVELLNGKIGVESTKEKGSTFWVTLPRVVSGAKDN